MGTSGRFKAINFVYNCFVNERKLLLAYVCVKFCYTVFVDKGNGLDNVNVESYKLEERSQDERLTIDEASPPKC